MAETRNDMQPMDSPIAGASPVMLGILGILMAALKLTWKNKKFMLSITVLVLPPFTLLSLGNKFLVFILMSDVASKEALLLFDGNDQSKTEHALAGIQKDFRILVGLELCFLIALWMVVLVAMMTTVYSSAMAYVGKDCTHKGMLSRIKMTLKRPAITWFYVSFFTAAYIVFIMVLIWLVLPEGGAFIALVALMSFLALVVYLYLAAVWTLGLIIAIIEDDCYGLVALSKAGELIRGRKVQGFVLMLFLTVIALALYVWTDYLTPVASSAFNLLAVIQFCLVKLFAFVVYTVFYYECKKTHGEKLEMHGTSPVGSNL
ncbi:hypothetical protein MRB53_013408 [Persea americana]|uniref:Uncharacterized protein n=1 Tax=Persea americana TaxID=3435 RepID=A0ACC2K8C9_PERAE|nr:hypothetical protein MRB53_013408 [Persea americana]